MQEAQTDDYDVYNELEAQRNMDDRQTEENPEEQVEQDQNQPIGWDIFLAAAAIGLIADAVELFTLGTIGWFVALFLDFILVFVLLLSEPTRKLWKKWTWGPVIEKFPIINIIPLVRVAFLTWAFISSRSSKLQKFSRLTHVPNGKERV